MKRYGYLFVLFASLMSLVYPLPVAASPENNGELPPTANAYSTTSTYSPHERSVETFSVPRVPQETYVKNQDVAMQTGDVYTWTQDARTDWEQGTLEWLDSRSVSGTLQLAQRHFGENVPISPLEELASAQGKPSIAVDEAGNAYAVWEDYRNEHPDVYFAYRPAGGAWGSMEKINDDPGANSQQLPVITVDASGNAYAVWNDDRNGSWDVYFAYRPVGGAWGANVKVNAMGEASQYTPPAIAVDGAGTAYALWSDGRNDYGDIYFATRPAGGAWSTESKVNDDAGSTSQYAPDIAVDAGGNVYAVWTDGRNGRQDIYFAHRPAGGDWGTQSRINEDTTATINRQAPDIAVDSSGNAYAVWADYCFGTGDGTLYFSYRPAGGDWGANVRVNMIIEEFDPFPVSYAPTQPDPWSDPDIQVDGDGNAYALWDSRDDIYFSTRPSGGSWITETEISDNVRGHRESLYQVGQIPTLAVDSDGNAYALWEDWRNGNADVYFAHCQVGGACSANVGIHEDTGTVAQYHPDVAMDEEGNAYAVWEDWRNGNSDVYFSHLPAGGMWASADQVNDDGGVAGQYDPKIGVVDSGNAHVVWQDNRNDTADIYAAHRSASGMWEANVQVSDPITDSSQRSPDIAVSDDGVAYAVWKSSDVPGSPENYISFAERPAGDTWGAVTRIVDQEGDDNSYEPSIAAAGDESLHVAWYAWSWSHGGGPNIYATRRSPAGIWSSDVLVNDDGEGTYLQWDPRIAADDNGNAYLVWEDERSDYGDIYFAIRPVTGTWSANERVNDDVGTRSQYDPAIAVSGGGNAYAVWEDYRDAGLNIYFATRPTGGSWGGNSRINDNIDLASQYHPAIAVDDSDNATVVWENWQNGRYAIYSAQSLPMPEYAQEGRYTSPAFDTGVDLASWGDLTYAADTPGGTSLAFESRSRVAGGEWSAWTPVNNAITSPPGQFLQYRVTFSTISTDVSPMLDWVEVSYTSAGTPSAPRFATPCGVTNQLTPTLSGSVAGGVTVHLYVDGTEILSDTIDSNASNFTMAPGLTAGQHVITATAENSHGIGPASTPLSLTVEPGLSYDPIGVRAGPWSNSGWLLSPPRDINGCANPDNDWRVWPRADKRFRVQVPVSYTTSAAVTVTLGTRTIDLIEESPGLFVGVFEPLLQDGDFVIGVTADGTTSVIEGGPVLIDPDGFVYEASGTISDTISGVKVTCYYSDTHVGAWVTWDAWNYDNQINPQITGEDGYFSFYTPRGTYRVVAEKRGYHTYTSPDLVVVSEPVRHNVPLSQIMSAPTELDVAGPESGETGVEYTFIASVNPTATTPITYVWRPQGLGAETHPDEDRNDSASFLWMTPGAQTIVVTASNPIGAVTGTHVITINPSTKPHVVITGPEEGDVNTSYTFTATLAPGTAVLPALYTWTAVEQSPFTETVELASTASFTWTEGGAKTVTVTVSESGDPDTVYTSDSHLITLQRENTFVYLPLVLRNE